MRDLYLESAERSTEISSSGPIAYTTNMATKKNPAVVILDRNGGKRIGRARTAKFTPVQRSESARKALREKILEADQADTVLDTSKKALHLCLKRIKNAKNETELHRLTEELQKIVFYKQYENAEN